MKLFVLITSLIINTLATAQIDTITFNCIKYDFVSIRKVINTLQKENEDLKLEIKNLNTKIKTTKDSLERLKIMIENNYMMVTKFAEILNVKITNTEKNTTEQIGEVLSVFGKKFLYGTVGIGSTLIITIVLYLLLFKRQNNCKSQIINKLTQNKISIEENLIKQLGKQTELLESQLQIIEQQNSNKQLTSTLEPDHSLPLKVATEINIIERNLSLMDPNIKGYKQLIKSVEKLKDNLNANGYEIIDLLGKTYHHGLPILIVNSYHDETLEKGKEVITKILLPAVRYNDRIIQIAQVEVSVGI